jgi:cytochrome c-type biogenesis protein CcmF
MRARHGHGESWIEALSMLFARHRQRYGGYVVHLGLVVLAVGVIGSQFFQTQGEADLKVGQTLTVSGYSLTYKGITDTVKDNIETIQTYFTLSQNGKVVGTVAPGEKIYPGFASEPASIVSITTLQLKDVYVFLSGYDGSSTATIRVFINPLVSLVWSGGLLMLVGGILCWWPEERRMTRLGPPATPRAAQAVAEEVAP